MGEKAGRSGGYSFAKTSTVRCVWHLRCVFGQTNRGSKFVWFHLRNVILVPETAVFVWVWCFCVPRHGSKIGQSNDGGASPKTRAYVLRFTETNILFTQR